MAYQPTNLTVKGSLDCPQLVIIKFTYTSKNNSSDESLLALVLRGAMIVAPDQSSVGNGLAALVMANATDKTSAWQAVLVLASEQLNKQKVQADPVVNEYLLSQSERFMESANSAKLFQLS